MAFAPLPIIFYLKSYDTSKLRYNFSSDFNIIMFNTHYIKGLLNWGCQFKNENNWDA